MRSTRIAGIALTRSEGGIEMGLARPLLPRLAAMMMLSSAHRASFGKCLLTLPSGKGPAFAAPSRPFTARPPPLSRGSTAFTAAPWPHDSFPSSRPLPVALPSLATMAMARGFLPRLVHSSRPLPFQQSAAWRDREGWLKAEARMSEGGEEGEEGTGPFLAENGEPLNERGRYRDGVRVSDTVLLHPHTDIAHRYWRSILREGDRAIDATCGNGHDTLELVSILSRAGGGSVVACDIQESAIESAKAKLEGELVGLMEVEKGVGGGDVWEMIPTEPGPRLAGLKGNVRVEWRLGRHEEMLEGCERLGARAVVFNLGYLPGGDKSVFTEVDGTMRAIPAALEAVGVYGCVSVTCYAGHAEGKVEQDAVLKLARGLAVQDWSSYVMEWANARNKKKGTHAPLLVLMQRLRDTEAA